MREFLKRDSKKGRKKTASPVFPFLRLRLASLRGFEPPAYRLGGGRSILLSYSDIGLDKALFIVKIPTLKVKSEPFRIRLSFSFRNI